jgi:hypothetical protein
MTAVRSALHVAATFAVGLGLVGFASAQEGAAPVTKVQGSHALKRLPATMVVRVDLSGKGADYAAALADLEAKEKTARLTLASLDADEKKIVLGPVATLSGENDPQARFREMVQSRLGNAGPSAGAAAEGASKDVSLTRSITARWPLVAKDAVGLVLEAETLKQKIEEADVAGTKDAGADSLAEEELMEEAEMIGFDPYTGRPTAPPGTPNFAYAAQITDQERAAALREAFADARKRADALAAAAGMEVESVASLEDLTQGGAEEDPYAMYRQAQSAGVSELLPEAADDPSLASVGTEPKEASFRVTLGVVFRLRPAAGEK